MRTYKTIINQIKKLGYITADNIEEFIDLSKELKENLELLKRVDNKKIEAKLNSDDLTYKKCSNYKNILKQKKIYLENERSIDYMLDRYEQNKKVFEQLKTGNIEIPRQESPISEEEINNTPIGDYYYCRHTMCFSQDYECALNENLNVINKYITYDYDGNIAHLGKIPIIVEQTSEGLRDLITGKLLNSMINSKFINFESTRKVSRGELLKILNSITDSDRKLYEANLSWLCMGLSKITNLNNIRKNENDRQLKIKLNQIRSKYDKN